MKIFNYENDGEKVYVQNIDILRLQFLDSLVAQTIYDRYNDTINNDNLMDFIKFDLVYEVNFFKNIDWIIDYRKVNQLSNHMIEYKMDEVDEMMNEVADKYNSIPRNNVRDRTAFFNEFKLLEYKKLFLNMLLELRYSDEAISMPLVPDSEGINFTFDINSQYEACSTLDPNVVLFYRNDGSTFSEITDISDELIETVSDIIVKRRKYVDNYFKNKVIISKVLSEDDKYLIVELKPLVKKKNKVVEEKGSKRLIRSRVKRNK